MKKLLSILASVGLVATAASTVVACTKQADVQNAQVDENGNVTFNLRDLIMTDTLNDINEVMKRYSVYAVDHVDTDGTVTPVSITDIKFISTNKDTKKFRKNHGYDFVITFKINDYEEDWDYKFTLATINGLTGKEGTPIRPIFIKKISNEGPDYVGWSGTGSDKGVANMGTPKVDVDYASDGKGYFTGYEPGNNSNPMEYEPSDGGKSESVSVDAHGYPVDTDGASTDNPGFGKRIVITKNKDGKYKVATGKCTAVPESKENSDSSKVYLDNDGYRIAYDKDLKNSDGTKGGWVRVSADGTHRLGPDSAPNSGNKAWDINSGDESKSNSSNGGVADGVATSSNGDVSSTDAPYVERDPKTGKVIAYLDKNGTPIAKYGAFDPETNKPTNNPGTTPIDSSANEYTNCEQPDIKDDAASANKSYDRKATKNWTLNGDVDVKLGKNIKANGSVTIGDPNEQGGHVTLNPGDADSHEWHTISKGKYAGMQVKMSDDGDKVQFRWPVSDKQIDDIIGGKDAKDSPISKDGKTGKPAIDVPLKFTDGKNGTGKEITKAPKTVTVSTPWNRDSGNSSNGSSDTGSTGSYSKSWWIDAENTDIVLGYKNADSSQKIRVNLTDDLAKEIDGKALPDPEIINNDNVISFTWDNKGSVLTDDNGTKYVEGTLQVLWKPVNFLDSHKNMSIDFSGCFDKEAKNIGTDVSTNISLVKVSGQITFDNTKINIDDQNNAVFKIAANSGSDVDYKDGPTSIKIKEKDNTEIDISKADYIKSYKWDATNKQFSVSFKDGSLSYQQAVVFELEFYVISADSGIPEVEQDLQATKTSATKSEMNVDFNNEGVAELDGYNASWTINSDTLGALIDKGGMPTISLTTVDKSLNILDAPYSDESWDGKTLSIKFNEIPMNKYTVSIKFGLSKGFTPTQTKTVNNLSIVKNKDKDVDINQGTTKQYTFGTATSVTLNLSSVGTEFDVHNIDMKESKIDIQGLTEGADYKVSYDGENATLTISLIQELGPQKGGLLTTIDLFDKNKAEANPFAITIAKDEPATVWSTPAWTKTSNSFDEKTIEFDLEKPKFADKLPDIDYSSSSFKISELKGTYSTLEYKKDFDYTFDGTKLVITIFKEQHKDTFSFTTSFNLANGYTGTRKLAPAYANKDKPLSTDFSIDIQPVEKDGEKLNSLDNNAHAQFQVTTTNPDMVDLSDGSVVKARLVESTNANEIITTYDTQSHIIDVSLAPNTEIPGGDNALVATFNASNAKLGYTDKTVIDSSQFFATKSEPTPGFTTISWKSTDVHMSQNAATAEFALDMDEMKKTGVDISTNKIAKIQQSVDGGNNWEDLAKDGTTYTYKDGVLDVTFAKDVINTPELKATPRQFKVYLAIGNGYENSKFANDNKDGFDGGVILKAIKDKATDFEKNITVDNANVVQDFNDDITDASGKVIKPWHEGTWHVSNFGPQIDLNNPQSVVITNTSNAKAAPYDPNKIKIVPPKDKNGEPSIDPNSPKKNPNNKGDNSFSAVTKGSTGDITLGIKDGALWSGDYSVVITYKLKDYDETTSITLKFSKTEANDNEKTLDPNPTFKNIWHYIVGGKWVDVPIKGETWVPNPADPYSLITHADQYYIESQITFKTLGGAVDITTPQVQVFENDGKTPWKQLGKSLDNKFFFISTKQNADGSITLSFRSWQIFLIGYAGPKHAKDFPRFKMTFNLTTFSGKSQSIWFDWSDYTEDGVKPPKP